MASADDVTLQEVARTLLDMRQEFRTQLSTLVRTDVYRAEQSAMDARIKRLEQDGERNEAEKGSQRRLVFGAFVSAAATLVVSLVMFLIVRP